MLLNFRSNSFKSTSTAVQEARGEEENQTGMSFMQVAPTPGTDGVTHPTIKCYQCQKMGHYANQCPDDVAPTAEVQMLHTEDQCENEYEYIIDFFLYRRAQDTRSSPLRGYCWTVLLQCQ